MADVFRDRERGEEAKFKLDEELQFKARCRRNKLSAQWAAERMGMGPAETGEYARKLVSLALERPGSDAVVARIGGDFAQAGVHVSDAEIVRAVGRCHAEALDSLVGAFPTALGNDHVQVGG